MKTTQMQIRFDAAKLNALNFYLPQKGTSVEDELRNKIDELYASEVPENVKQFIGFQTGDKPEHSDSEVLEDGQEQTDKPSRRHKSSPKAEAAEAPAMASGQTLTM